MNKENKFKDLIGITGGIINSLEGVKEQSKQIIKSKITTKFKEEKNTVLEKKIKYLENKIKKL